MPGEHLMKRGEVLSIAKLQIVPFRLRDPVRCMQRLYWHPESRSHQES